MLLLNADRMKERNRNAEAYTHQIQTLVPALDSYFQDEEDDVFRLMKFEVFIFSFLTYANCNIGSADYCQKEFISLCRLCQLHVVIIMPSEGRSFIISYISHFPAGKTIFLCFSIQSCIVLATYKYLVEER